jgi:Tol biopolymer transport system component
MRRAASVLSVVASVVVTAGLPAPAAAVMPGDNGKIAFQRTDANNIGEIYVVNPDGSGEANITNDPGNDYAPAWSPDGSRILFVSDRDPDLINDGDIYTANPDGSNVNRVTVGARAGSADWSPDGTWIVFYGCPSGVSCETFIVDSGGGDFAPLCAPACNLAGPSWSPYGEPIAFSGIEVVNSDGTGLNHLSSEDHWSADWAPDYSDLVTAALNCSTSCFSGGLRTVDWPSGTIRPVPGTTLRDDYAVYSPDGERFAVEENLGDGHFRIVTMRTDGSERLPLTTGPDDWQPDWQTVNADLPVPRGYPRPKSASPVSASLVIAYRACSPSSANRTHGPPLAYPSCRPPVPVSTVLTVGTADSNGAPTRFLGTVKLTPMRGNPATPADEADMTVEASLVDIRCAVGIDPDPETEGWPCRSGAMTDYTGEVEVVVTMRITDKLTQGGRTGTLEPATIGVTVPCTATPDDVAGGTCAVTTTMDSVVPGVIPEGARSVWQLDGVEVWDGGIDGDVDTSSDQAALFATQGVFVP